MHRFAKRILAVGLAALGMLATNTPPASAATAGTIDFSVIVRTPPLGYLGRAWPVTGTIAITHNTACVGASLGKATIAGTCSIYGAGNIGANAAGVGAYCDHSAGSITGTFQITDFTGRSEWWNYTIHFTTAGGVLAATGTTTDPDTGQWGSIVVEGVVAPVGALATNSAAGSCPAGTATEFSIVGTADYMTA